MYEAVRTGDGGAARRFVGIVGHPRVAACLLFVFSLVIHSIDLDRLPHNDELFHVLGGRSVLVDGVPRIGDGVYDRGELYTWMVAGSFKLFGESLAAARLPSILAGSLLVAALFLWCRAVADSFAAWIAALMFDLAPLSFQLFEWSRFYAVHALLFWLAAVALYGAVARPFSWLATGALAAGGVLALAVAWSLQPITLLGVGGILVWLALAVGVPLLSSRSLSPPRRWGLIAGGALAAAILLVVAVQSGLAQDLFRQYRAVHLHAAEHKDEFWFYHLLLLTNYAMLWTLLPFIMLLALAVRPQPSFFCSSIFVVTFLLLSFGGMKDQRYIFFITPFLFVLWGIAVASALPQLVRWFRGIVKDAVGHARLGAWSQVGIWLCVVGTLVFVIGANGAWTKTALRLVGVTLAAEGDGLSLSRSADAAPWLRAQAELQPLADSADIVVTTRPLFTLYYLGDYDVAIGKELPDDKGSDDAEFAIDPRTGRAAISTPSSLELILACYAHGVLFTDKIHWRHPNFIDADMAVLITTRMMPIRLPATPGMVAFRWDHQLDEAPPGCLSPPSLAPTSRDGSFEQTPMLGIAPFPEHS